MKKRILLYPLLVSMLFACDKGGNDGQEPTPDNIEALTTYTGEVSSVRISEDGKKVYYGTFRTASSPSGIASDIRVINHDGTGEKKLLNSDGIISNLVVRESANLLAFTNNITSASKEFTSDMLILNLQGQIKKKLAHTIQYKTTPYFILSSNKVLYNKHGNYSGECSCNTIWSLNMLTDVDKKLNEKTDLIPTHDATLKDITPDEKIILFTNVLKGTYTMGMDGNNLKKLDDALEPIAISPDGKKILAQKTVNNSIQVFTLNLDGSAKTQITNFSANSIPIDFSPDGKKILFSSNKDHSGSLNTELYLMNVDGSDVQRLTHNDYNEEAFGFLNNGTSILFASGHNGAKMLYVLKNIQK